MALEKIVSADLETVFFPENMVQGYDGYEDLGLNYKRTSTQEKGWSSEAWDEFDKCNGNEILFDLDENDTVMGQMFYEKWKEG